MEKENIKLSIEILQRSKIITAIESVAITTFGIQLFLLSAYFDVTETLLSFIVPIIAITVLSFNSYALVRNIQKRYKINALKKELGI